MKDFRKRLLVTTFGLLVIFCFFLFSDRPLGGVFTALFLFFLCFASLKEYGHMLAKKKIACNDFYLIAFSICYLLFAKEAALGNLPKSVLAWPIIGYLLAIFYDRRNHVEGAMLTISSTFFPILYIAVPISLVFFLLYDLPLNGKWWFLYLVFVTKCTDIGAYIGGRLFGKTPLCPRISPQKTKEGAFFGILGALVCSLFFSFFQEVFSPLGFSLSYQTSFFLGLTLAIFSQLGDLFESFLKRDAGIKDSNTAFGVIFPGIGGALDLIDSLLFTAPFLCCILYGFF